MIRSLIEINVRLSNSLINVLLCMFLIEWVVLDL